MNPLDAAVAQYSKTIVDLSARLAQAAAELASMTDERDRLAKELEDAKKPKEPPQLKAVDKDVS